MYYYTHFPNKFIDEIFESLEKTCYEPFTEKDDSYILEYELPRVKPEDIDISFNDGNLLVKAKNRQSKIPLKNADGENATAKLEYGVLTITVPKLEAAKSIKIEVT